MTSSSYSGSTLLAFLLNTHPDIATVGEMEGWEHDDGERFTCSCGKGLETCSFFRFVADRFAREGLAFDVRRFGTRYCVAEHARINRYLTAELPLGESTRLERLRDRMVGAVPWLARTLATQDRANLAFIRAGLAYRGARVFVDACKGPFRLRRLRRVEGLDLRTLCLVRDPRAFALSNKVKWGWDVAVAARVWLRQQRDILRIVSEGPPVLPVHYETLCDHVEDTLLVIQRFLGVEPRPFRGDFRSVEHHILGNWMRWSAVGSVVKDTRWQRELSPAELRTIARITTTFAREHEAHPLSRVVLHYLGRGPDAPAAAPHRVDLSAAGSRRS